MFIICFIKSISIYLGSVDSRNIIMVLFFKLLFVFVVVVFNIEGKDV